MQCLVPWCGVMVRLGELALFLGGGPGPAGNGGNEGRQLCAALLRGQAA